MLRFSYRERGVKALAATLFVIGLIPSAGRSQDAATDSAAIKQEIRSVLESYKRVFSRDFRVKITCAQITNAIELELAKVSPVPVSLPHLVISWTDGVPKIKPKFTSLPPAIRATVEAKADSVINSSPIGKAIPKVTYLFSGKAIDILLAEHDFEVLRKSDELLDVKLTGINEPFAQGLTISSAALRIDRAQKSVSIVKVYFDNGKSVGAKIAYEMMDMPGTEEKIPMQRKNVVVQDAFADWRGVSLPRKFVVEYSDYRFM